jgi:nucleoside-triphosphatase THEP1
MVTNEIREDDRRIGFQIETLSGSSFILASKQNLSSRFRVSSYGVYLDNVVKVVKLLEEEVKRLDPDIIVIDEIGKMELFSSSFKRFLEDCLDTQKVLGTIMLKDTEYSKNIKERSDTDVFLLTRESRTTVKEEIIRRLK